jgi:hypothetical protein
MLLALVFGPYSWPVYAFALYGLVSSWLGVAKSVRGIPRQAGLAADYARARFAEGADGSDGLFLVLSLLLLGCQLAWLFETLVVSNLLYVNDIHWGADNWLSPSGFTAGLHAMQWNVLSGFYLTVSIVGLFATFLTRRSGVAVPFAFLLLAPVVFLSGLSTLYAFFQLLGMLVGLHVQDFGFHCLLALLGILHFLSCFAAFRAAQRLGRLWNPETPTRAEEY